MATIRPFIAQRFSSSAGRLEDLVAPPYDVLSQEQRDALAAKNEHNTVWITLPERNSDDRSQFVRYGRSASRLAEWRRNGSFVVDEQPGLYLYEQSFTDPVTCLLHNRTAIVTLLKTEPYDKGVVLPHEQTFPKHKEDRLRILEATRSHLECIYGLYADDRNQVENAIDSAKFEFVAEITTDDGIRQKLSVCRDLEQLGKIVEAMSPERVWIADGHHRYETACTFREQSGEKYGVIPEDFMMIALSSMRDPGLVLLPTHRIISKVEVSEIELKNRLQKYFNLRTCSKDTVAEEVLRLDVSDTRAFGILVPGETAWIATLDKPEEALNWVDTEGSELLRLLDVTILHDVIIKKCLGIEGLDRISYTRDAQEAIDSVANGAAVAIITNPPSVLDMSRIAENNEKMPQKSTFYYPKLLSGLLFWSLSDFK